MEENKKKEKNIMPIIWGVIILMIIAVLIVSNSKKNKENSIAVDSDKVVQIETKHPEEEKKNETKTEVVLSKNSIILSVGGSETLEITSDNKKKLTWSSSHPSIASVDASGKVTALSMGTAIIKGQSEEGNEGQCTIIVKGGAVVSKKTTDSDGTSIDKVKNPIQNTNNNNNYTPSQPEDSNNNYNDPDEWNQNEPDEPEYPVNPDEPIVDPDEPEEPTEVVKCLVTFMVNGKLYTTKEVEEGQELGQLPSNPNNYGYTFRGWYNGDEVIDTNTIITENIVIEAIWDTYTFELSLINNDEKSPNRIVKAYKNGQSIDIKELYGTIGDNSEYTLAIWNKRLNAVKCISAKQVESASDYMIVLNSAAVAVYANEK